MRSGIRTRRVLACFVLVTTYCPLLVWGQGVASDQRVGVSAPVAQRRLPYRLQPTARTSASRVPVGQVVRAATASQRVTVRPAQATPGQIAAAMGLSQGGPVAQPTEPSRAEDVPMLTGPETVFDPTAADSLGPVDEHVVVEDPAVVHEFSPLPGEVHDCDAGLHLGPAWMPGLGVDHLSLFGGVHGFKNGGNRGEDASFGFHEGANFGTAARNIVFPSSIGLQLGFQATQSNIEGAAFTSQQRNQLFLTGGVFRRADCGLQGGLVFDYLWDDWYYELQVGQARGEISAALNGASSIGVWFATSVDEDTVTSRVNGVSIRENWETTDIYALFFRSSMLAAGRGEGRLYAGFSGDSDGIIGADSRMPLTNGWALETDFTYLVPDGDEQFRDNQLEAWNLAINLVWYPGSIACGECFRAHRPLFDVANNGSLILRPQR